MKIYPAARPYITAKDKKSVLAVLNSDHLSLGPKYQEFEIKFAKKIGTKYACAVSSGTAGLHLALIACGIGPGDEVITSTFSFVASANVILYVGAKPVFVDVDPLTYNIDTSKIEARITKKTKAILVVHIFGQCSDMDPITKIAKKYKLQIIEDACESISAAYKGKQAGTFGQAGVFAFYPNKQMTTGEGGMIVMDNKKIYDLCNSLRNQGRGKGDIWLNHECLGYNYRLDEMSAALGISQLEKLDFMIHQRRKIAQWYNKFLEIKGDIIQAPYTSTSNFHTWFVYVVKIKNKKIKRDSLIKKLEAVGISAKPYLPSIHQLNFYKRRFNFKAGVFPIAEDISAHCLSLPMYLGLRKSDCYYIIKKVLQLMRVKE